MRSPHKLKFYRERVINYLQCHRIKKICGFFLKSGDTYLYLEAYKKKQLANLICTGSTRIGDTAQIGKKISKYLRNGTNITW